MLVDPGIHVHIEHGGDGQSDVIRHAESGIFQEGWHGGDIGDDAVGLVLFIPGEDRAFLLCGGRVFEVLVVQNRQAQFRIEDPLGDQIASFKQMAAGKDVGLVSDEADPFVSELLHFLEGKHGVGDLVRSDEMGARMLERAAEAHRRVFFPREAAPVRSGVLWRQQDAGDAARG